MGDTGFAKAPTKREGAAYNAVTGEEVESLGYVHEPVRAALSDLHYAVARIESALSNEHGKSAISNKVDREVLEITIRHIEEIKFNLLSMRQDLRGRNSMNHDD
jgi:hypothetical protein